MSSPKSLPAEPGAGKGVRAAIALILGLVPALASEPAAALTPSPADWRDLVIYQVLTDRFFDGDPSNNAVEGNYAPADGARIHGGDFEGIEAKLDYLTHLGVDAIWISPVSLNANAEYHGYAARDLFAIAPHFGTLAELQSMVAAAHARGIYVVIDVVVNHMGDLVDSGNSGYPSFRYPGTYTLRWRNASKRFPGVLDDLSKFHAHGHVQDFGSETQTEKGELFGLDDLKTEDAAVRQLLVQAAEWMIANTDCDGFRIDTVKHVEMPFWNFWSPGVHAYAASQGKNAFFLFGEVFDGSDTKNGSYTGTMSGGNYKLDSVLHFPMYFTTRDVFCFDNPPDWIAGRYTSLDQYDPSSRERLVTFLDNHDNARFLSFGLANQDESRLRAALGWLLTSRGVPCVYYGTEQEFDGGGDPWNREDMWDGQWDFGPSEGDNFDLAHPLFRYVRRLTETRRRHEALRRGITIEHFAQSGGPGLYLYERRSASDTVLVAVNNSNAPIVRSGQSTPWPAGAILVDAIDAGVRDTTGAAGAITLRVPARSVRVIESLAAYQAAEPDRRLAVQSIFPGHDQTLNDRESPITVVFDREVDAHAVSTSAHIVPATAGTWAVETAAPGRYVAHFFPDSPWTNEQTYTWSLDATLRSRDGQSLAARFEARFRTSTYTSGITTAPEYAVDRIARQGLAGGEGLVAAPWIAPYTMLISDTGRDRINTITTGGDLGHRIGDGRWTNPEGLVRTGATTSVIDPSGVYSIDERAMTTLWSAGSPASSSGAAAYGDGGFGGRLYLSDPAGDRIVRLLANGTSQAFATGILGGEGLAFGPGGDWGTDLYVADANLATLGSPANGVGRIVRIDPNGVVTTVVQHPLLLGASALAFDPGERFGGHLYVADILGDRILQVTAAGAVSVFASGFNNLSGSQCLAFGEDGALYVADPGSGQPFSNTNGTRLPQVLRIARRQLTTEVPPPDDETFELALAPPAPNPARSNVGLRFTLARARDVRLEVLDLSGRRVRMLIAEPRAAGEQFADWDLADEDGRGVPAGIYRVRLSAGLQTLERRLAVIR